MPLAIYYTSPQPASYQIQRQLTSGSDWADDNTQSASGVVLVSALTYNGTTPGVSVATNHGWTLLTDGAYRYRVLPTYADGSIGLPSLPVLPTDRAAYECMITGRIAPDWSGKTVRAILPAPFNAGDTTYLTREWSAEIDIDGAWTLDGLPRGASVTVVTPDGTRQTVTIPDADAVLFTDLANTPSGADTLTVYRGATFTYQLTYVDDTGPVDLSGASAALTIRKLATATDDLASWSTATGEIVMGGTAGTITVTVNATDTEVLDLATDAVWDLVVTIGSTVSRIIGGSASILPVVSV
jgi:hypothetical protein